jgi:hypothetical protein
VNKAFTPRAVETMRPRIQAIVDELLDAVQDRQGMDVIGDLAYPLPETLSTRPAERWPARGRFFSDEIVKLSDGHPGPRSDRNCCLALQSSGRHWDQACPDSVGGPAK